DLGETSACEAHVELQRGPPDTLRRDFELAVAGYGPALGRADRHLGPVALERRVFLVAEKLPELRQEALEALVRPRGREPHAGRRRRVAGENDASPEEHDLLRRHGGRAKERQQGEHDAEQGAERRAQAFARVVQTAAWRRNDGGPSDARMNASWATSHASSVSRRTLNARR